MQPGRAAKSCRVGEARRPPPWKLKATHLMDSATPCFDICRISVGWKARGLPCRSLLRRAAQRAGPVGCWMQKHFGESGGATGTGGCPMTRFQLGSFQTVTRSLAGLGARKGRAGMAVQKTLSA